MTHVSSPNVLKCPYCEGLFPSHKALRIHVGNIHRGKIDNFMEEFYGGRSIEVEFVTFMLQRSIANLTSQFCDQCNRCSVGCPISKVVEGFTPRQIVTDVQSGKIRELLKSNIIWKCTSCLLCKEQCPDDTSPYDIIMILRNLSARIGYHFPKGFKDADKTLYRLGLIQEPRMIQTKTGEQFDREGLCLSELSLPSDARRFTKALNQLSRMRVVY